MCSSVCRFTFILICLVLWSGGKAQAQSVTPAEPASTTITGTLIINWADLVVGDQITASRAEASLFTAGDQSIPVTVDPALAASVGGLESLQGKQVAVTGMTASDGLAAASLTVLDSAAPAYVTPGLPRGHSKWIFLLCAAPDSPLLHPDPIAHYTGLLSSAKPGLSHYWTELSYGAVDLAGSAAAGWFPLPQQSAYYVRQDPGFPDAVSLDPVKVAADCVGAADATVDFSQYEGVAYFVPIPRSVLGDHIVFRGGFSLLAVDGPERVFRTIWFPTEIGHEPNYDEWLGSAGTVAHEMGHGFNLPHSSAQYGQVYDSRWDVMSYVRCGIYSQDYFCFGQHTIGYHKDRLGWIAPSREYTLTLNSPVTLELTRLALPPEAGYLLLKAPIGDGKRFYTAEARRQVGYDVGLLMNGVIIHEVDPVNRPYQSTAEVVDGDNNGDPADDGTAWTSGETFHGDGSFTLCVLGATPTGFRVAASIGQSPTCTFAVDFSPSTLSADDPTPAAGQPVTLSVNLVNYGMPADRVTVTATVPAGTTYVTDTARTTQGEVLTATAAGPIVFHLGTVTGDEALKLDYTILVKESVVSPTLLIDTATIEWNTGSLILTKRLIANAKSTFLPVINR